MNPKLIDDIRNYLNITWDDVAGDLKIAGIIQRGIKYLNSIAGKELDYSAEDKPREILFDYVRYVRSDAFNDFQKNYNHELNALLFLKGGEDDV